MSIIESFVVVEKNKSKVERPTSRLVNCLDWVIIERDRELKPVTGINNKHTLGSSGLWTYPTRKMSSPAPRPDSDGA